MMLLMLSALGDPAMQPAEGSSPALVAFVVLLGALALAVYSAGLVAFCLAARRNTKGRSS